MDVLKKIRASTLVENLLATVVIMVIFVLSGMTINNAFKGVIKNDLGSYNNRIKELTYLSHHSKLMFPFYEETSQWDISIEKENETILITALHKPSSTTKEIVIDEKD